MDKIEMTLATYDALMTELAYYKEVYEVMITPSISSWEIDNLKKDSDSYIKSADMTEALKRSSKKKLLADIKHSVETVMLEDHGIKVEHEFKHNINFDLGIIRLPKAVEVTGATVAEEVAEEKVVEVEVVEE